MSNGQADYLLRYFPSLSEQANQQAEDALEGNIAKPIDTGRHGQGKHGDQTAARALMLVEAHSLAGTLSLVRQWIDNELKPGDRSLLLAVWRSNRHGGWWWVSNELSLGVIDCQIWWTRLTVELESFLTLK